MTPTLHTAAYVHAGLYQDSVALMRVAQGLQSLPGVVHATLQMGSAANKDILRDAGLLDDSVAGAGPADIMVVVQARGADACRAALAEARARLSGESRPPSAAGGAAGDARPAARALRQAAGAVAGAPGGAGLAQISVPGPYAAAEALKALALGLDVFLFSDNVPLAQEVALKREAQRRGRLVMGPDCGTAIVGGVPLGFANAVRRGSIGLVAASGTGLQEVTSQIHRLGGGVSQAIGTGGRDLQAEVGAVSMRQGIALLARDPGTRVIAIISKPPAPEVAGWVRAALEAAGKPAVVLFIGEPAAAPRRRGGQPPLAQVGTLVDCAAQAVRLAGLRARRGPPASYPLPARPRFARRQRWLRALYSGGTFAAEAQALWSGMGLEVWSNVPLADGRALPDARRASRQHTVLDLGDDAFTVGRPHPMIDATARIERLLQEAADPEVRVLLLDVVIGWGAHADPAAELAPALREAQAIARRGGRRLAVIGFVCGTDQDPQGLARQEAALRDAGMVLAGNSANAAWLAREWVR